MPNPTLHLAPSGRRDPSRSSDSMYSLTCPHCDHVKPSPFVRIGAVVDCESCGKRIVVEARHVRRRVAATKVPSPDVLVGERVPPVWGLPDDSTGESSSAAGSRQSKPPPAPSTQPAAAAASAPQPATVPPAPPAPAAAPASPPLAEQPAAAVAASIAAPGATDRASSRRLAMLQAKRRRRVAMLSISGGMTAALVIMVVVLLILLNSDGDGSGDTGNGGGPIVQTPTPTPVPTAPVPTPTAPPTPAPPTPTAPVPPSTAQTITVHLKPAEAPKWEQADSPARTVDPSPVSLVDVRFIPEPSQTVRLEGRLRMTDGAATRHGLLGLELIDANDQVFMRGVHPLSLVAPGVDEFVRIQVPNELIERTERYQARVLHTQPWSDAQPLQGVSVEAGGFDSGQVLNVSFANTTGGLITSPIFVFEALDAQEHVTGQWHFEHHSPIRPDAQVRIVATVPIDAEAAAQVARWRVHAVGGVRP